MELLNVVIIGFPDAAFASTLRERHRRRVQSNVTDLMAPSTSELAVRFRRCLHVALRMTPEAGYIMHV